MDQQRARENFTLRTGITTDDLNKLGHVALFSGMPPDDLRRLLTNCSMRLYPSHTTLFMEGEPADRFYVAIDGWVKLYRSSENGNEVTIADIAPGESFAEAAIFAGSNYPVSGATLTDARLLVVGSEAIKRALHENNEFAFNMLASMSRHMRRNITLLHQLSAMSTTERLAQFLVGLCNVSSGETVITLPMDKSLIASRLGMQPETFSRALAKLKKLGVASTGHNVEIKDVSVLYEMIKKHSPGNM